MFSVLFPSLDDRGLDVLCRFLVTSIQKAEARANRFFTRTITKTGACIWEQSICGWRWTESIGSSSEFIGDSGKFPFNFDFFFMFIWIYTFITHMYVDMHCKQQQKQLRNHNCKNKQKSKYQNHVYQEFYSFHHNLIKISYFFFTRKFCTIRHKIFYFLLWTIQCYHVNYSKWAMKLISGERTNTKWQIMINTHNIQSDLLIQMQFCSRLSFFFVLFFFCSVFFLSPASLFVSLVLLCCGKIESLFVWQSLRGISITAHFYQMFFN